MPEAPNNGNHQSRLDRLEGLMELLISDHVEFQREHKQLLTAQVLLTDVVEKLARRVDKLADSLEKQDERVDKLDERVDRLAASIHELAESLRHTDERLNALIAVVDDLVRKRPPQP